MHEERQRSDVARLTLRSSFFPGAIFGLGAALGIFYWRHRDALGATSDSMLKQVSDNIPGQYDKPLLLP